MEIAIAQAEAKEDAEEEFGEYLEKFSQENPFF